jgi:cation diffusion facilitator family transporter
MQEARNIRVMRAALAISLLLMAAKFAAWYITGSGGILSDALESVINILAGAFALYSISFAARPRDENHPYGHGKIEYISSGFEGGMILLAGLAMIVKGAWGFFVPYEVHKADAGAYISAAAGLVNFAVGSYLVRYGKKNDSPLIVADGRHLITDTVSSVGLVLGLVLIYLTGLSWIDYLVTVVFGISILYTGFRLVKEAVTKLLDEADEKSLTRLVTILSRHRTPRLIDVHNLRALKYGTRLHIDAHITLPYYLTLEEVHTELTGLQRKVESDLGHEAELFLHADPCLPLCCPICSVANCPVRQADFTRRVDWSLRNTLPDRKHQLGTD